MADRAELYLSENDYRSEPLAAKLADILIGEGAITRVDARGRAVDENGEYTEGTWDEAKEKYIPNTIVVDEPVKAEGTSTKTATPAKAGTK